MLLCLAQRDNCAYAALGLRVSKAKETEGKEYVHRRISTSIERSQAEPRECWLAGPSQSLLPGKRDRMGQSHVDTRKTSKQNRSQKCMKGTCSATAMAV